MLIPAQQFSRPPKKVRGSRPSDDQKNEKKAIDFIKTISNSIEQNLRSSSYFASNSPLYKYLIPLITEQLEGFDQELNYVPKIIEHSLFLKRYLNDNYIPSNFSNCDFFLEIFESKEYDRNYPDPIKEEYSSNEKGFSELLEATKQQSKKYIQLIKDVFLITKSFDSQDASILPETSLASLSELKKCFTEIQHQEIDVNEQYYIIILDNYLCNCKSEKLIYSQIIHCLKKAKISFSYKEILPIFTYLEDFMHLLKKISSLEAITIIKHNTNLKKEDSQCLYAIIECILHIENKMQNCEGWFGSNFTCKKVQKAFSELLSKCQEYSDYIQNCPPETTTSPFFPTEFEERLAYLKDISKSICTEKQKSIDLLINNDEKQEKIPYNVRTRILLELLKKVGVNENKFNKKAISRLISFITGQKESSLYKKVCSNEVSLSKSHQKAIEQANKYLSDLKLDIILKID